MKRSGYGRELAGHGIREFCNATTVWYGRRPGRPLVACPGETPDDRCPQRPAGATTLSDTEAAALDAHWRAANYLAVGQIYLMANPLLRSRCPRAHQTEAARPLGHLARAEPRPHPSQQGRQGAEPAGTLCLGAGPRRPRRPRQLLAGRQLFGDVPGYQPRPRRNGSRCSSSSPSPAVCPATSPRRRRAPSMRAASWDTRSPTPTERPSTTRSCSSPASIGDGEAETGPLAASWHSNKFLDPVHDGAVLPILHLNGYKIANPTVLARLPEDELDALLRGYGHDPLYVEGDEPAAVHRAHGRRHGPRREPHRGVQRAARAEGASVRPRWPMIVLRTPKGWTGPDEVDGVPVENTWRAHQVPLPGVRDNPDHLRQLEEWMRSYRPEELFDSEGRPTAQLLDCVPEGAARLGADPVRQRRAAPARSAAPSARGPRGAGRQAGRPACTSPPGSWADSSRTSWRPPPTAGTSASWAPTRPSPTAWTRSTKPPARHGRRRSSRPTSIWPATAG